MILARLTLPAGWIPLLGWGLLHFLGQGTMIAFGLLVFLRVARNCSSQTRYLACCFSFAWMLLCPVGSFFYFMGRTGDAVSSAAASPPTEIVSLVFSAQRDYASSLAATANREMPWILVAWCAGVLVILSRLIAGCIAVKQLKSVSGLPLAGPIENMVRRLAVQLTVSRQFRVAGCDAVSGPSVVGWLKPMILVPTASFAELVPEQVEAVLAHELAHIRRHDYLVSTFQAIGEALLFYHPAIWWVSRQMRRERENCCDDLAVVVTGSPLIYAKALSVLEQQRAITANQWTLAFKGGKLKMRIERILKGKQPAPASPAARLLLVSIATITLGAFLLLSNAAAKETPIVPVLRAAQTNSREAARKSSLPDLECAYYGKVADREFQGYPGTCEFNTQASGKYQCAKDGEGHLKQEQAACQWKIERRQAWELDQQRKLSGEISPQ